MGSQENGGWEAPDNFDDVLLRVTEEKERIVLTRHGEPVGVMVPVEEVALLDALDTARDTEEAQAALEEWERTGKHLVSWEQIKSDLKLC